MPSRLNYPAFDIAGAHASVITPDDDNYAGDAEEYGVDDPDGRCIVGIGADHPDVVLLGAHDDLVALARDILHKLG